MPGFMVSIFSKFLLLMVCVLGFAVNHYFNPKNRLSRGLEAFWNTPSIKEFRMFVWKAFWVLLLGGIALTSIDYYCEGRPAICCVTAWNFSALTIHAQ